ncbi:MAG: radical SAM protein [Gemmatimonadota bacterium]
MEPFVPLGHFWEEERTDGGTLPTLTVFLAGAECPFTCIYCDLWRRTLEGPTPPGALPAQLHQALEVETVPPSAAVKLYNASNFFDPRAVPPADEPALLELLRPFVRVTVESHPRLVGRHCLEFASRLEGRLEVALGLETVHPEALPRLNKQMTLADFDRAARVLRCAGIPIRAFVLVGAPFVAREEAVYWAVCSAEYAYQRGAGRVSLIPVRGGNGALEVLDRDGKFFPPCLGQLEEAFERTLELEGGIAQVDLWDAHLFASCAACSTARIERLARMNLTGQPEPRPGCPACGWS